MQWRRGEPDLLANSLGICGIIENLRINLIFVQLYQNVLDKVKLLNIVIVVSGNAQFFPYHKYNTSGNQE